jgi:hypothetical protein
MHHLLEWGHDPDKHKAKLRAARDARARRNRAAASLPANVVAFPTRTVPDPFPHSDARQVDVEAGRYSVKRGWQWISLPFLRFQHGRAA